MAESIVEVPNEEGGESQSPVKVNRVFDHDHLYNSTRNHAFNMFDRLSVDFDAENFVEGMMLIEPMQLYNIMMQVEKYPCVSDPNYLLLVGMSQNASLYLTCHSLEPESYIKFPFSFRCSQERNI